MMNKLYSSIKLLLAFVILSCCGCSSFLSMLSSSEAYKKEFHSLTKLKYFVYAKPSLSRIQQIEENSYLIDSNTEASFKVSGLTSFKASFTINFLKGDQVLIYFRTVKSPQDSQYVLLDCGLSKITIKVKRMLEDTSYIQTLSECHYKSDDYIFLKSDGKKNEIRIGCNHPIIYLLDTPQTEYVTTQTINGSRIILNDFKLEPL